MGEGANGVGGSYVFFLNVTSSREKDMVVVGRQVKSIDAVAVEIVLRSI